MLEMIRPVQQGMLLVASMLWLSTAQGQMERTRFNGFGHIELTGTSGDDPSAYFSIGEHDFFVTSTLSERITFLGEYVIRPNGSSATNFLPSIERSLVRYTYANNHSIIMGKVHTPVNYWNDVYHHGRLFFPVIDRPLAFSYLVPLHTLGFQLQGQNLGRARFGYDVVVGNGISSSDFLDEGLDPSLTVAFHVKPVEGMRVGLSYYYDFMRSNAYGAHSGHSPAPTVIRADAYKGPLSYHLGSFSFAYFTQRWEVLNEACMNASITDSLGTASNWSNFTYVARRIGEKHVVYGLGDVIEVGARDLHVYPLHQVKLGLGYRHEFSHLVNVKVQVENRWDHQAHQHMDQTSHLHGPDLGIRIQLAYGF
jgi:hypothetical protein